MAEDEVGLLEEAANVVPDQRFDDVGADTWIVAGRAAFFVGSVGAQLGRLTRTQDGIQPGAHAV